MDWPRCEDMREPRDLCAPSGEFHVEQFRIRALAGLPNDKPCWTPFLEAVYDELSEHLGEPGAYKSMVMVLESVLERQDIDDRVDNPRGRYLYNALKDHVISIRVSRTGQDYEIARKNMEWCFRCAIRGWEAP